jgi:transcriptional regulator with XRE-family HTH domain
MENLFGTNIRKIRELKNIGQQYMAEKLGISQSSYSDIENNRTKITSDKLDKIAQILSVSIDDIKNFSESVIFNSCTQSGYINTNNINPLDKIQDLYERLLSEKDAQIAVLKEQLKVFSK